MAAVGFEPTPPGILVPSTSALDRPKTQRAASSSAKNDISRKSLLNYKRFYCIYF